MEKKIVIYHGSKDIVRNPSLYGGKKTNDYGYGFYCTKEIELANEWACQNKIDGYTNEYVLDLKGLKILDLSKKNYHILNWIALLLKYRLPAGLSFNDELVKNYIIEKFSINLDDIDIIIGYRADDSYFSFARDFVKNTITVSQLSKAMELGKLGLQVVLHSHKAFEHIKYVKSYKVNSDVYYTKRHVRDLKAKEDYQNVIKHTPINKDSLFVMDIIRQGVENDDPRLSRNVSR